MKSHYVNVKLVKTLSFQECMTFIDEKVSYGTRYSVLRAFLKKRATKSTTGNIHSIYEPLR